MPLAFHGRLNLAIFAAVACHFRLDLAIIVLVAACHFCSHLAIFVLVARHFHFDIVILEFPFWPEAHNFRMTLRFLP